MPMKVQEVVRLLEADGWTLKRTSGSHRQVVHPVKPGLVTLAGKPKRGQPVPEPAAAAVTIVGIPAA